MLRACNRLLKPGGKLAFYVIHVQPGLTPAEEAAARDAVPGFVDAPAPYATLVEHAGFVDIAERDVTAAYREISALWLEEVANLEQNLRAALGESVLEEKRARRVRSLAAVEAGYLGRTLVSARAS